MNWLQTNGIIYLPVVVKGATVSLPFAMLKQCCVSVADGGPTMYQHCVDVTCLLGLHSQQKHSMFNPALQLLGQRQRQCPNFDPALR